MTRHACGYGRKDSVYVEEAQGEAERAFGNPAAFPKDIVWAKHLEVQISAIARAMWFIFKNALLVRDDIKK